jgi:antitoxin (DNA-binding transcriptional repressor) of toxin-antitoxin stability system
MLEFRKNTAKIIRWSKQGQKMIMTYRGKPIFRLEPIVEDAIVDDDPFYRLTDLADETGENLTNQEIDKIIYDS